MSNITRAFSSNRKGVKKLEISDPMPQRSLTARFPQGQKASARGTIQISAPVELVSTTNMLSYNAPDIRPKSSNRPSRAPSAASSITSNHAPAYKPHKIDPSLLPKRVMSTTSSASASADDSYPFSDVSTPITSTDNSSVGSLSPTEPEKNHLSCYFQTSAARIEEAPEIPTRALSHTKKNHEIMSRKRSSSNVSHTMASSHPAPIIQQSQQARLSHFNHPAHPTQSSRSPHNSQPSHSTYSTQPSHTPIASQSRIASQLAQSSQLTQHSRQANSSRSCASAGITHTSVEPRPEQPRQHPFGQELTQVSELAEDFGISPAKLTEVEQEEQELRANGFCKFTVDDYMFEIADLCKWAFTDSKTALANIWI